ncbi:MAG: ClbS/DfsB family four-helix bundle protein [Chloroflexota bacterium]
MDRTSLFIELYAGRERLRAALASLPESALLDRIDDEWTRKDVVAHIGAWERRFVELLERLRRGEWPEDAVETDQLNARFFENDRDRPVPDVLQRETADWDRFIEAIEGMTDDELFDPRHFGWTQGDPLVGWVTGNASEHIDEHLEQLTRPARSSRRAEPARTAIA